MIKTHEKSFIVWFDTDSEWGDQLNIYKKFEHEPVEILQVMHITNKKICAELIYKKDLKESESEEPSKGKLKHPIITCKDYLEYMEWLKDHEQKPQQGKARFITNGDDYINIQHISSISKVEDKTYIFVDGNERAFIVDKPINEVIQMLETEVI